MKSCIMFVYNFFFRLSVENPIKKSFGQSLCGCQLISWLFIHVWDWNRSKLFFFLAGSHMVQTECLSAVKLISSLKLNIKFTNKKRRPAHSFRTRWLKISHNKFGEHNYMVKVCGRNSLVCAKLSISMFLLDEFMKIQLQLAEWILC